MDAVREGVSCIAGLDGFGDKHIGLLSGNKCDSSCPVVNAHIEVIAAIGNFARKRNYPFSSDSDKLSFRPEIIAEPTAALARHLFRKARDVRSA